MLGAVAGGIQDRSLGFLRDPALWSGILSRPRFRFAKSTFFLKDPRVDGSEREPSGPHLAGRRETAFEPNRLHPPRPVPSSVDLQVDGSERGGPGLPGPGDRTTPSEPSCPNHGGVRALSPAGHANDGGTTGLRAPPGIAIPIAPLHWPSRSGALTAPCTSSGAKFARLRSRTEAGSVVVRDYRALETGRRRANRLVLTVTG